MRDTSTLENDIASLPGLDLKALRARWLALYGLPAAKSFRRKFLARALAYQMQVDAYGGLPASTKHRLRDIAAAASAGTFDAAMVGPRIKPDAYVLQVVVTDAQAKEKRYATVAQWLDFEIVS